MKKIINITAGLLLAFSLFAVTACQKPTSDEQVVGVLLRNDSEVFLSAYRKGIEAFAEKMISKFKYILQTMMQQFK